MKLTRLLSSTAVAATLLWAGAANAELYQFTVSGDYAASWQIDTEATPDVVLAETGLTYWDVVGTYAGNVTHIADVSFFHESLGGGVSIYDFSADTYLLVSDGAQLYSGSEDSPTFLAGSYALSEYEGTGSYTLTISAVPEPATYGMMLGGLGLVGIALRRRQGR